MATYAELYKELHGQASFESLMSGEVEREIEYTIYARIPDLAAVKKRALEVHRHEQWNIKIDQGNVDGKMRIRLIDDTRPTMCTKIKREGVVGADEVEMDITKAMFDSLREMGSEGYIKTRYSIPATSGLCWEVDVFLARGGAEHEWVKIDLEVKDINEPIPPLPFDTSRFIIDMGDLSYSDKAQIKRLWDDEWLKLENKK